MRASLRSFTLHHFRLTPILTQQTAAMSSNTPKTTIIKITGKYLGAYAKLDSLDTWVPTPASVTPAMADLESVAKYMTISNIPVAFPTETVYGLGADATRSSAVQGIYTAKNRPSDNPLISHVADLDMLRALLDPSGAVRASGQDPIPEIYKPLIEKYWPGPLTILLPNSVDSKLAPEVTAGQITWGVRIPQNPLALSLIKLVGAPLAAPSANSSTKPSPTTAQHVMDDLNGRIEKIIDGGSCTVGVESTIVDGLKSPPAILRPGGISLKEIQQCRGWEVTVNGYKDQSVDDKEKPQVPGMKYKHYSPNARVTLYESSHAAALNGIVAADFEEVISQKSEPKIGIIRTQRWGPVGGLNTSQLVDIPKIAGYEDEEESFVVQQGSLLGDNGQPIGTVYDINLTSDIRKVAEGLFQAFRTLDRRGVDSIFIDGVADHIDIASAVMNRARKAASQIRR